VSQGQSRRSRVGRPEGSTTSKIVTLLEVLGLEAGSKGLGLSEISKRTGMSRPSAHRLLSELIGFGFVDQDPVTDGYRLGLRTVHVAWSYLSDLDVRRQVSPYLPELVERTKETAHLMILAQGECVCIDQIESPAPIRIHSEVGKRIPLHATASGKALVAHEDEERLRLLLRETGMEARTRRTITDVDEYLNKLKEVRERGFALDNMEHEDGVRCVAAPVFDHEGRTAAAVCISGPASRMTLDRCAELGAVVVDIAESASKSLGFNPDMHEQGRSHRQRQKGSS
jgi:IclR family transcriptional regulator, KDG regulon repressor